jgi:two-component system phosphate regulon response regulator PhoB
MALTILIVEDEIDFGGIVALNLTRAGFSTIVAKTGEAGLEAARTRRPDLILLDLMLPDVQGTEVVRRLKADASTRMIPIIMATARGEEIDRIVGFELGVDDYVVKPFSMREMVLRVNAVLRRGIGAVPTGEEPSYTVGPLFVDGPAHRVFLDGREIELTALEFRLLVALVTNRGRVMTREVLLERVWGIQADIETRTVDTMTKRLRDKLGVLGRHVETVRGVGYRFSEGSTET